MVASLLSNARSRRRTSVTSLTSTNAPEARPPGRSGSDRNSTVAPLASTSIRRLDLPCTAPEMRAASSAASNGSAIRERVRPASTAPWSPPGRPSR